MLNNSLDGSFISVQDEITFFGELMIDLDVLYLKEIRRILQQYVPDCDVWAYNPELNGFSNKYSDLNLALTGHIQIDWLKIEALEDAFKESELPFSVSVIDLNVVTEDFRHLIENNH